MLKEAKEINDILNYLKKSKSKQDLLNRYQETTSINFFWSSFKSDEEINSLKEELLNKLED